MIDQRCVEEVTHSRITLGPEKGRKAVVRNLDKTQHLRIQVDNCVTCAGPRADWVLERGRDVVIVELKGRNVEHGADQILATAEKWKNQEQRADAIAGLIVGRQVPAASTTVQIKKNQFAKRYGGPLHVVNANCEYELAHLLSFKGPFKA